MSSAVLGIGTKFRRNGVTIAECTNISLSGNQRDAIDVTNFDSVSPAKEFIAGLLNCANINLTMNFLPQNSTQQNLTTDLRNSGASTTIPQTFSIVWPDAALTTWTFSAFVTEVGPVAKVDDKLTATVSVKVVHSISIV